MSVLCGCLCPRLFLFVPMVVSAMILRMRPKKKAKTAVGERTEKAVEHQTKFPGLAMPDSKVDV